jgi:hypothetical protein
MRTGGRVQGIYVVWLARRVSTVCQGADVEQLKSSWRMTLVCSLLCGLLASCDRPDEPVTDAAAIQRANTALSVRKLPKLPDTVTSVRFWSGGMFAKYMNIKFSASPDQALDFLRRAGAACYVEFQIEGKKCHILATHPLAGALGDNNKPELYMLAEKVGILARPWFRSVYDIRHGWYYHHFYYEGAPVSYYLFYDVDSQQFYVYWTYS